MVDFKICLATKYHGYSITAQSYEFYPPLVQLDNLDFTLSHLWQQFWCLPLGALFVRARQLCCNKVDSAGKKHNYPPQMGSWSLVTADNHPILDTRISVRPRSSSVMLRPPRSWIQKRGGLESSGQRLIPSNDKTKRIYIYIFFFFLNQPKNIHTI